MFSYLELHNHSPMTNRQPLDYVSAYNKRSLRILARALTLAVGQFSLILVRCNYAAVQQQVLHDLSEYIWENDGLPGIKLIEIEQIILNSKVNSLYNCIEQYLVNRPCEALMISGFESVKDLDRLLKSTNQMREELRQNFSLPIVLWLTDEVLQKLVRFAPDFKSWGACSIKFEMSTSDLINILSTPAQQL